ncbi:hypothetical protein [Maribacter sp. MJ134]|uniref:hypothetical protein n=1 Tax=Maribacter sp. MJ134 TaxID=2496865 RepID=UPI001F4982A4|nr:hypothetical protein [Maribacter sp. MJ134]
MIIVHSDIFEEINYSRAIVKNGMTSKKRHWFWNLVMIITFIICLSSLVMHYKNWVKLEPNEIQLLSGFYRVAIPYADMDSVLFVERIPPMERLNGFSALEKEKGIFRAFKDSLTESKIHVFVDNISQQKIKIVYKDSLKLFVNLKDSVETLNLFNHLQEKSLDVTVPN